MSELKLTFENDADKQHFISWFLDSGGEDGLWDYTHCHNLPAFITKPNGQWTDGILFTADKAEMF